MLKITAAAKGNAIFTPESGRWAPKMYLSAQNCLRSSDEKVRAGISNEIGNIGLFHPLRKSSWNKPLNWQTCSNA